MLLTVGKAAAPTTAGSASHHRWEASLAAQVSAESVATAVTGSDRRRIPSRNPAWVLASHRLEAHQLLQSLEVLAEAATAH